MTDQVDVEQILPAGARDERQRKEVGRQCINIREGGDGILVIIGLLCDFGGDQILASLATSSWGLSVA